MFRVPDKFAFSQQLALHEFKVHGKRAQEWQYVQSEVCPGCLKTFHTSFRVCQHLRYRNNRCWERVHGARQPAEPVSIQIPDHLEEFTDSLLSANITDRSDPQHITGKGRECGKP